RWRRADGARRRRAGTRSWRTSATSPSAGPPLFLEQLEQGGGDRVRRPGPFRRMPVRVREADRVAQQARVDDDRRLGSAPVVLAVTPLPKTIPTQPVVRPVGLEDGTAVAAASGHDPASLKSVVSGVGEMAAAGQVDEPGGALYDPVLARVEGALERF